MILVRGCEGIIPNYITIVSKKLTSVSYLSLIYELNVIACALRLKGAFTFRETWEYCSGVTSSFLETGSETENAICEQFIDILYYIYIVEGW